MKKKAYIIDVYSKGSYHEVVNQSYLMMVSELYEDVVYIGEKTSCENLQQLLDKCHFAYDNVKFEKHAFQKIECRNKGLQYLLKILHVSFLDFFYYMSISEDADIFYNNNLFGAILLIQWLSFGKKNRIFDMCHNEMELIDALAPKSRATLFISVIFSIAFKKIHLSKKFHFILLSPKMVKYFCSYIPTKNKGRIFSMDLSYIRPENNIDVENLKNNYFKIGLPGAITPTRGLSILKDILGNIQSDDIFFYGISTISEEIEDPHFEALNKDGKLMPFARYNAYVKSMDALMLLYDINSYKLTASAAILEAIWNEKPIIALKNSYFNYLFETFGEMGVLCDDVGSLILELHRFVLIPDKEKYIKNIREAKRMLLPINVKNQLLKIINFNYYD